MSEGDEGHHRIRDTHQQHTIPFRRRGRTEVAAPEVVPVLRFGHLDPVPGLVLRIRPGAARGPQNESAGGVTRHIRHDRQQ